MNKREKKVEVRIPPQRGQVKVRILKEAAKQVKNAAKTVVGIAQKKVECVESAEEDIDWKIKETNSSFESFWAIYLYMPMFGRACSNLESFLCFMHLSWYFCGLWSLFLFVKSMKSLSFFFLFKMKYIVVKWRVRVWPFVINYGFTSFRSIFGQNLHWFRFFFYFSIMGITIEPVQCKSTRRKLDKWFLLDIYLFKNKNGCSWEKTNLG